MSTNKETELFLNKLESTLRVVVDEARMNPDFCMKLARAFGEEVSISPKPPGKQRLKVPEINIVEIMHAGGESELHDRLQQLTNEQLVRLSVAEGILKPKAAKSKAREVLISLILNRARDILRQGEAFTKPGEMGSNEVDSGNNTKGQQE